MKKELSIPEWGSRRKDKVHYTSYRIPIEVARGISVAARSASLKLTNGEKDDAISQTEAVIQMLEQTFGDYYTKSGVLHDPKIKPSKVARAEVKEAKPKAKKEKAPKAAKKATPKKAKSAAAPKAVKAKAPKVKKPKAARTKKSDPLDSPETKAAKENALAEKAAAREAKKKTAKTEPSTESKTEAAEEKKNDAPANTSAETSAGSSAA